MNNNKLAQLNIFIGTSITKKVGKPKDVTRLRTLVETIDSTAETLGATTKCAFREEEWKGEENPVIYVPRDLKWCKECDGAILIPEDSDGVRIEEGWLSAFQKPMLRLYEKAVNYLTGIEQHLHLVAPVFDRIFNTPADAVHHVEWFIDFLANMGNKK
jgi:hypothetical protein